MIVQLQTLGAVGACRLGESLDEFVVPPPKAFAVVVYLAVDLPGRPQRRDALLSLVWPELDDQHGRQALRQTLFDLNHQFGPPLVVRRGNEGLIANRAVLACDAVRFREALEDDRPEDALTLYAGHFLTGFHLTGCLDFERWIDRVRDRLRRGAVDAAWTLARRAHDRGCRDEALSLARRAVDLAPYCERGWRCLVRLLAEYDDRAAARVAYERLHRMLVEDFEIGPSDETRAVMDDITQQGSATGPWYLDRGEERRGPPAGSYG